MTKMADGNPAPRPRMAKRLPRDIMARRMNQDTKDAMMKCSALGELAKAIEQRAKPLLDEVLNRKLVCAKNDDVHFGVQQMLRPATQFEEDVNGYIRDKKESWLLACSRPVDANNEARLPCEVLRGGRSTHGMMPDLSRARFEAPTFQSVGPLYLVEKRYGMYICCVRSALRRLRDFTQHYLDWMEDHPGYEPNEFIVDLHYKTVLGVVTSLYNASGNVQKAFLDIDDNGCLGNDITPMLYREQSNCRDNYFRFFNEWQ